MNQMMYCISILLCVIIIMTGCKEGSMTTNHANKACNLAGRYFNRTVLDNCPNRMPVDVPHYALELSFDDNDSVDINNGVEKYRLPFVKADGDCTFTITGATQFGDMTFVVNGDSAITLLDSAWTKNPQASTFSKNNIDAKSNWTIENFINECVIAGTYSINGKDGKPTPVYFLPNGQVTGIKPYLSYELCYAGDCLEETAEPSQIIEFTNDKAEKELFVIRMPNGKKHVQFFKVGPAIPDTKGERSIGEMAFELTSGM